MTWRSRPPAPADGCGGGAWPRRGCGRCDCHDDQTMAAADLGDLARAKARRPGPRPAGARGRAARRPPDLLTSVTAGTCPGRPRPAHLQPGRMEELPPQRLGRVGRPLTEPELQLPR